MKPLVIMLPPYNKGDRIEIDVDILKQYIDQAYASGYADGLAAGKATIPPYAPPTSPYTPPASPTMRTITWDWSKTTCSDNPNIKTRLYSTTDWTINDVKKK